MDFEDIFKIVVIGGLALFLVFAFKGCVAELDRQQAVENTWCSDHGVTHRELEIFARIMNVSPADVISSEGLQKEFERFENGDLRQTGQEVVHHGKSSETRNTFH